MKITFTALLALALLLLSGCAQKVNDPAVEQAIRSLMAEYEKAANSRDLEWFSANFYAEGAVLLPPNAAPVVGREAIEEQARAGFDRFSSSTETTPVVEVLSSGDLAVVRGTYDWKGTPKAEGVGAASEQGKWTGTFRRQANGSWKCFHLSWSSNLPAPGTTSEGREEKALLQLERDWVEAAVKADVEALDRILGVDYVGNSQGSVTTRAQLLSSLRSGAYKVDSVTLGEMQAMVLGDRAVVQGVATVKGSERGKDTSGKYLWTDVFAKRDDRWQCVANYATKLE